MHRERLFLAANRVGKTEGAGGYETTLHLTGEYPGWWDGKRFAGPVRAVVAGDTAKAVRDIIQRKLLGGSESLWGGPPSSRREGGVREPAIRTAGGFGTGLIPADAIRHTTAKAGVTEAVDTARVRHVSGGESRLVFRSYDQGREAFQGDEQDVVWLDEEPPLSVYTECLMRTMTTGGVVMLTFTPLNGYSEVVRMFVEGEG